jgi:guanylate kinase
MNELQHLAEFQSVLKDYQLSDAAKQTLAQTKLVVLVGPTSSGRNTIIAELLKTGEYAHIVSDTTRKIREKDGVPIEQNGREYWFRNEDDVLADLKNGEYMEMAVIHNQQASGCSIRELEKAHKANKIAIKDIEPNGAQTVHDLKPDTIVVFVTPPNFDDWMNRLRGRGALPEDEIRRRLESAPKEFAMALSHDYYTFVLNDNLEHAVTDIHAIVTTGYYDPAKKERARQVVERLHQDTQNYLASA